MGVVMSKTTVVIDDELMEKALKATGAKTKRQAIEEGLRELVRKKQIDSFRKDLGTFEISLSLKELKRLRGEK
jgi:Arc/MetJ family transcription regulator